MSGDKPIDATIPRADHDQRVAELLAANNREVERRRRAENALRLARIPIADEIESLIQSWSNGATGRREDVISQDRLQPFEEALAAIDRVLADG